VTERLHIGVDLDDVVLNFEGGIIHAVETEYDVVVPPFTEWEMRNVLDPIIGKSWWKWMRERDWLWPNFPAVKGAIGGIAQLRDDGHYLEIITSKPEWAEFSVWKWLGKWRPPVHRVTIVNSETAKIDVTDADVMIDDKPDNLFPFAEDGRVGILFKQHRYTGKLPVGVYRADTWAEVVSMVRLEASGELAKKEESWGIDLMGL